MPTTREKVIAAQRALLVGTAIDMTGPQFLFKTIAAPTVFTIINPVLGRVVMLELDGIFAVTLPVTVDIVTGDYLPNLGLNYLMLVCNDAATPAYVGTWSTGV
jgi:hypothetical protein